MALPVVMPVDATVIEPDPFVTVMPDPAVKVVRVKPVPFPMSNAPFAGVDERPVPPFATVNALVKVKDVTSKVPVEGVYLYFVELVYSVVTTPLVAVENSG